VHWNEAAATWDCPCHGGRFLPDGSVLYGPPTRPLQGAEAVHAPLRAPLPPAAEAGGAALA
jgi:Rieske Fe-S protein